MHFLIGLICEMTVYTLYSSKVSKDTVRLYKCKLNILSIFILMVHILTCLVSEFKHIRLHVHQVMIKLRVQNPKAVLISHVASKNKKRLIKTSCTLLCII